MSRQIDALIAEHVFDNKFDADYNRQIIADGAETNLPHYSTQIQDAWLVADKFKTEVSFSCDWNALEEIWSATFFIYTIKNKSAPMAISLAALKALGVEIPNE